MLFKKSFVKLLSMLTGITTTIVPSFYIVSCGSSQVNNIVFVSQSADVVESAKQKLWITFQFTGKNRPQHIKTIEFLNNKDRLVDFSSSTTNLQLDDNGQFTFAISLHNELDEAKEVTYSFIVTYDIGRKEYYETITSDKLHFQYDYHNLICLNPDPETILYNDFVTYNFELQGILFPNYIDDAYVIGEHANNFEIKTDKNIPINENHTFSLEIKTKDIELPAHDTLDFQIEVKFTILNTTTSATVSNIHSSFFYPKLDLVEKTTDYLVKHDQIVDLTYTLEMPDGMTVSKLDKVDIVFDEKLTTGGIRLLENENILLNKKHQFTLSLLYESVGSGKFETTTFKFSLSYVTDDGLAITDYLTAPETLWAYKEPSYSQKRVQITALSNCSVSILNHGITDVSGYNIQYQFPAQLPNKYELSASDAPAQQVNMMVGETVEFSNDSGKWSQGLDQYLNFSFSGPVLIQGDITALLNGQGGTKIDLLEDQVFNNIFMNANVIKVDDNFLWSVKTVSTGGFSQMFDGSELVFAPEIWSTVLNKSCFSSMFANCKSLIAPPTNLPIHEVPAMTYYQMFHECSSLQYTPVFDTWSPLDETDELIFGGCFQGCLSLKEIYLPTWKQGWDDTHNTFKNWVEGVSSDGIFYYNGDEIQFGINAIPNGWTVTKFLP